MSVALVLILNLEFAVIKREIKDGMYVPVIYCLCKALLELPWMLVMQVAASYVTCVAVVATSCPLLESHWLVGWAWVVRLQ